MTNRVSVLRALRIPEDRMDEVLADPWCQQALDAIIGVLERAATEIREQVLEPADCQARNTRS